MTLLHNGFTRFSNKEKNIFGVHLKHSSFWPSAHVKPMPNDQAHAVPRQCMFALSKRILHSVWPVAAWEKFQNRPWG